MSARWSTAEISYNLTDFDNIFDQTHPQDSQIMNNNDQVIDELDFSKFLMESGHLRTFLPEEVWIRILARMITTKDLTSLSNSSPYFRHLLQNQSATFLFHKVFEILAPKYEQDKAASCYREKRAPVETFEYSSCYESSQWERANWNHYHCDEEYFEEGRRQRFGTPHHVTGIMKCRLVCSGWNKAIENYYQKTIKLVNNRKGELQFWEVCELDCFHDTPRLFVEHFENSHNQPLERKTPFLGRSVHIYGYRTGNVEQPDFITYLRQVLETYGQEIWYCVVELPIEEEIERGCVQMYLRFKEWLKMMPNLKTLKIYSGSDDFSSLSLQNEELLSMEILRSPVPTLEHLEFLDMSSLPPPISNELIRANNHITGLQLKRRMWAQMVVKKWLQFKYFYELGYQLPGNLENLRKLAISTFSEEMLRNLERESWCARNVDVLEVYNSTGSALDWERVLKVVSNKWGGTLKELTLKLGKNNIFKEDDDEEENLVMLELNDGYEMRLEMLKKLEKLTVHLYQPMKLDFVLKMKNTLEFISLVTMYHRGDGYDKGVEENGEIEFFGFEDCMEKSNIWDVLDKLKVVQVKNCRCGAGCWRCKWSSFKRPKKSCI